MKRGNMWSLQSLAIYYSFSEQAGSVIRDYSGNGHDWHGAVTTGSGITWDATNPKSVGGPWVRDLDARIRSANGSSVILPVNGFDALQTKYATTLAAPLPDLLQVIVGGHSATGNSKIVPVLVTGPTFAIGRSERTVEVGDREPLLFPLTSTMSTQRFTVTLPSDGLQYEFTVATPSPAVSVCPAGSRHDGHLKFDGTAYTRLVIPNQLQLTSQTFRSGDNARFERIAIAMR